LQFWTSQSIFQMRPLGGDYESRRVLKSEKLEIENDD